MAKKKVRSVTAKEPLLIGSTETEAGLQWLNSLPEDQFRDRILVELFRRMQAEGVIEAFEKIHGRNDKGVDFLVSVSSAFGPAVRGIQVKSKQITRSESFGAWSAVRIREECQAAMLYDFHFKGRSVRVDGIDVWCSAPITEDGEKELNPPHASLRIGLKKDRELLTLIERYCPSLLDKVPQFAIAKYIADSRNPGAKAVRILGCNLNPSLHFIEPFFSPNAPSSFKLLKEKHGALTPQQNKLSVQDLIEEPAHSVILAPPLSGRTYLLEHLKCRFAVTGRISVTLKVADIPKGDFKLEALISRILGFASPKQVQQLQEGSGLVILVDDIDKAPAEVSEKLLRTDQKGVRIVATARRMGLPQGVKEFHVSGVDWISIVRFLRSVDNSMAAGKPFVDRAKVFVERAFESSGLPRNPFTIAVMLEECQQGISRFSTPTMGRLIARFIELQLGSHTDLGYVVDFETKREFLTRLAGHARDSFAIQHFERLLGKFIDAKGHPHSITDFSNDLLRSGVFQRSGDTVEWSHPVIKEFFWVKSLVSNGKLAPVIKRLETQLDPTLAALVGSQMEDADILVDKLLPKLAKVQLPRINHAADSPELLKSLSHMISDQEEEALLADIESERLFMKNEGAGDTAPRSAEEPASKDDNLRKLVFSTEQKLALRKKLDPIFQRIGESELHVGFNIASLILNARDTSRTKKEACVDAVICSCQAFAEFTHEFVMALFDDVKRVKFLSSWLSVLYACMMADSILGDPHLITVFRSRLKRVKGETQTLILLDLLIGCGEEEYDLVLEALRKANNLGITLAIYWRVAMLYFFRFHRDKDRGALRKLLTAIRKMEPRNLPKII